MPKPKELPPQKELKHYFDYDPETGLLFMKNRYHKTFNGKVCGFVGKDGYLVVDFKDQSWYVHRIIWKLVYGFDPEIIDHSNNIRLDNKINNLRNVNAAQSRMNVKKHKNNKSGYKGVSKCGKGWQAMIIVSGKTIYLGGKFKTKKEAHNAYCEAAKKYHGDFANFG